MKNNFYNKDTYINLYEKASYKSKISSQVIYGEKFKILSKKKGWLKIKTAFDKYVGYTKNIKYSNKFLPTHKISVQKANIFSFPKKLRARRDSTVVLCDDMNFQLLFSKGS